MYPGEAVDLVDVVEQHEAENRADTGHGLQQIPGVGVMVVGGCDDGECHVAKPLGIGGDERQIDCETFLHRWIGKACGNALTVGFVGDLFADGWQMILAVGIVDMCQELSPCRCQRHATPEQVAGGAHLGGRHRGLREHTAAQKRRNLLGIARVVCGLPTMESLHGESMPQDKGRPSSAQRSASQYQGNRHSTATTIPVDTGPWLSGRPPGRFS